MKEIALTKGFVAIVDDDDYDLVAAYKWQAFTPKNRNTQYAQGKTSRCSPGGVKTIRMHRLIMNAQSGEVVDHVDHNGLNNVRSNLRVCSDKENHSNHQGIPSKRLHSSFKGVSRITLRDGTYSCFRSQLTHHRKMVYLGTFDTEIEAAVAYDLIAKERFGEFAHFNFDQATRDQHIIDLEIDTDRIYQALVKFDL